MSTVQPFPAGGYRFIGHQFQYSGRVAAERRAAGRLRYFFATRSPLPEIDPPATPLFYAFSYTVPSGHRRMPSFVAPEAAKRARGRLQSIPVPGSSADAAPHDKPPPERIPLATGWRVSRAVETEQSRYQHGTRIVMIAIRVGGNPPRRLTDNA